MQAPIIPSTDRQVTLGVVAICRNEERGIARFLEHLLPWVNKIVWWTTDRATIV